VTYFDNDFIWTRSGALKEGTFSAIIYISCGFHLTLHCNPKNKHLQEKKKQLFFFRQQTSGLGNHPNLYIVTVLSTLGS
jgi:hypothetical protein